MCPYQKSFLVEPILALFVNEMNIAVLSLAIFGFIVGLILFLWAEKTPEDELVGGLGVYISHEQAYLRAGIAWIFSFFLFIIGIS